MKTTLTSELDLRAAMTELAGQLLGKAQTSLQRPAPRLSKGVHDARKAFKKARSLLRMMRAGLDDDVYERVNEQVRDIARSLAAARDKDAMRQALERFVAAVQAEDGLTAPPFSSVTTALDGEHAGVVRGTDAKGKCKASSSAMRAKVAVVRAAARKVELVRDEIVKATLTGDGAKIAAKALARAYDKARKGMKRASREPSTETLHEWRKQVKHYWYMAAFLGEAWHDASSVETKDLEQLAELLGDDHDLWMLHELALRNIAAIGVDEASRFMATIDQQRTRLQLDAFRLGREVLEERPLRVKQCLRERWRPEPESREAAEPTAP